MYDLSEMRSLCQSQRLNELLQNLGLSRVPYVNCCQYDDDEISCKELIKDQENFKIMITVLPALMDYVYLLLGDSSQC